MRIQQGRVRVPEPAGGISIPPIEAFLADRTHGFDPSVWLPRGRVVALPLLDAVEDVPLDLEARVGDRAAVLLFFQGGWSRPCNEALGAFQSALPDFERAGAALVAITPELPRHARETAERNAVGFIVAIDHCCRFAKSLGLAFKLPRELRRTARDSGVRLKLWNGEGSYDLPMPTLILLDRRRRVRAVLWANRTSDLDPGAALAALRQFAAKDGDR